ncbi:MAG: hypothetical protein FWE53_04360 [Firmicutes bacterium]|nr:hypothetical protein [Bacillota bacterium]
MSQELISSLNDKISRLMQTMPEFYESRKNKDSYSCRIKFKPAEDTTLDISRSHDGYFTTVALFKEETIKDEKRSEESHITTIKRLAIHGLPYRQNIDVGKIVKQMDQTGSWGLKIDKTYDEGREVTTNEGKTIAGEILATVVGQLYGKYEEVWALAPDGVKQAVLNKSTNYLDSFYVVPAEFTTGPAYGIITANFARNGAQVEKGVHYLPAGSEIVEHEETTTTEAYQAIPGYDLIIDGNDEAYHITPMGGKHNAKGKAGQDTFFGYELHQNGQDTHFEPQNFSGAISKTAAPK